MVQMLITPTFELKGEMNEHFVIPPYLFLILWRTYIQMQQYDYGNIVRVYLW